MSMAPSTAGPSVPPLETGERLAPDAGGLTHRRACTGLALDTQALVTRDLPAVLATRDDARRGRG